MKRTYDLKPITRGWYTKADRVFKDSITGKKIYRFNNEWDNKWNLNDKKDDDSTIWYPTPTAAIIAYLKFGEKAVTSERK